MDRLTPARDRRGRPSPGGSQRPASQADHPHRRRARRGPAACGCSIVGPSTTRNRSPPRFFRRTCANEEPGGVDPVAVSERGQHGRHDFSEALAALVGPEAKGLSATTIVRLKSSWEDEFREWNGRSLADKRYVYLWADGVHFNIRLEEDRQCILVLMGATADGRKELIAVVDGFRESEQSWKALLLDVKARGLVIDPESWPRASWGVGLWKALPQVYPTTREHVSVGSQDGQRVGQIAEAATGRGQGQAARDLDGMLRRKPTPTKPSTCSWRPTRRSTRRRPTV